MPRCKARKRTFGRYSIENDSIIREEIIMLCRRFSTTKLTGHVFGKIFVDFAAQHVSALGQFRLRKLLLRNSQSFRVLSSGGTFEFQLIDLEDASSQTPGITQCNQETQVGLSGSVDAFTQIDFSTQTVDSSMQTSQLVAAIDDKHTQTQKTNLVDVLSQTLMSMVPVATPVAQADGPRILILGDGDFGFSRSIMPFLAPQSTMITATSFEDEADCYRKYTDASENVAAIRTDSNTTVKFGLDVRTLAQGDVVEKTHIFDFVIFNFPRTGLTPEVSDSDRMLLKGVLIAMARLLTPQGIAYLTLREPDIESQALGFRSSLEQSGLKCVFAFPFCVCKMPHYSPRRTNKDGKIPKVGNARTFVLINPAPPQGSKLHHTLDTPHFTGVMDRFMVSLTEALQGVGLGNDNNAQVAGSSGGAPGALSYIGSAGGGGKDAIEEHPSPCEGPVNGPDL